MHREPAPRDVCTSAEGFADILKRRLLRSVLTLRNFATFKISSGLSNDRCPTGYRLSILCLLWYGFCVCIHAHARTLNKAARGCILYSAWASRCQFYEIRQCDSLKVWNWQKASSALFCMPLITLKLSTK